MYCPKCGKDAGENKFCPECGEETTNQNDMSENNVQISCDAEANDAQNDNSGVGLVEENINTENEQISKPKKSKKIIAIVIAAVVIVLAIAISLFLKFGNKEKSDTEKKYTIYLKDNSIYYLSPESEEPILITESFLKNYDEVDAEEKYIPNLFEFSEDDKIFYPEKVEYNESFSLYYKYLNDSKKGPVKLAENVVEYSVSDDGKSLIYIDAENNFYYHNMEERKKILSDVESYWISDDCTSIAFLSEDGSLYVQLIDGEKEKIDSDVSSVEKVSGDLSTFYYFKESDFYVKKGENDRVKVDTEVNDIVKITEAGEIYYTKSNDEKSSETLLDFVIDKDGQAEIDENIVNGYKYVTDTESLEAYLRYWTREELKEHECNYESTSLYYYNGEKNDLINSAYNSCFSSSDDSLVIKSFDNVAINNMTIEEIVNSIDKEGNYRKTYNSGKTIYKSSYSQAKFFDEFEKTIEGVYNSDATVYLIKNGTATLLNIKSSDRVLLSNDSDAIFYSSDYNEEKDTCKLYKMSIVDNKISDPELYDEEITPYFYTTSLGILYSKDKKDESYDLYLNKELISYDVHKYEFVSENEIIYLTEYDTKSKSGTAYLYSNGESVKIGENIYSSSTDSEGNILYFSDYSPTYYKGDLYSFDGNESQKIDYDVTDIYNVNSNSKYRTFYYNFDWSSFDLSSLLF